MMLSNVSAPLACKHLIAGNDLERLHWTQFRGPGATSEHRESRLIFNIFDWRFSSHCTNIKSRFQRINI